MFTMCTRRNNNNINYDGKKRQVKGGYLLRYRRGFFCKNWCEEWVVLYDDSTLAWFTDKSLNRPRGYVRISEAPDLLAVGEWTRQVPRKPQFPRTCHVDQLLAIGCKTMREVHWLMGQTPKEINDWMTAISNTLPPPPSASYDKRHTYTRLKNIPNGYAKPIANGYATIIPNGSICPSISSHTTSDSSTVYSSVKNYKLQSLASPSAATANYIGEKLYNNQRNTTPRTGKFDNDHTVLSGVVIDWGQGWGWLNPITEIATVPAPTLPTIGTEAALSSAFSCPAGDDYTMAGLDDVDWSALGDFCF